MKKLCSLLKGIAEYFIGVYESIKIAIEYIKMDQDEMLEAFQEMIRNMEDLEINDGEE